MVMIRPLVADVEALEVREGHRGQGIGADLMRWVEAEAVRRGFQRLTLMVEPGNAEALRLYERLGFVKFEESLYVWRGKEYPTLCMAKAIG